MHEHLDEFGLINMNGRMYDPKLCSFISPDPQMQAPDYWLNHNRYAYCLNNPLKYNDPSGEDVATCIVLGGILIGAYWGGSKANDSYNPSNWDYSSANTYCCMVFGAYVGGLSSYFGGLISNTGLPFANTASIMGASFFNSLGTRAYTFGKTPISVCFGAFSYDFTNKEWGYLGKDGNEPIENICYGLGAMANVSDILVGLHPEKVDLVTEHSDGIGHSAIVEEGFYSGEQIGYDQINKQYIYPTEYGSIISVGPDINDQTHSWHWKKGLNKWPSHAGDSKTWRETLTLNKNTLDWYAKYINNKNNFHYSVELSSCVSHASLALNLSGVFNIGIHPYLLHAQMWCRNVGLRPSLYSYYGLEQN